LHYVRVMTLDTVRWTVSHDEARVVCVERAAGSHVEVHVTFSDLPIATRRCADTAEAARYSDELRRAWEAAGWK